MVVLQGRGAAEAVRELSRTDGIRKNFSGCAELCSARRAPPACCKAYNLHLFFKNASKETVKNVNLRYITG